MPIIACRRERREGGFFISFDIFCARQAISPVCWERHRLKEHIRGQIRRGEIKLGDLLPSENALAKEFRLSRHTIRQALGDLEQEGLVYLEQGKGTFCAPGRNNGRTIAVVTTNISEYIFPSVIRGIEEVLSAAGYALVLANVKGHRRPSGRPVHCPC